jgi:transketolase
MKNKKDHSKLKRISNNFKKKIIEISYKKKTHHIGSCLSCVDILTALYFGFMKISKTKINHNDKFIMSKGHAALTYYLMLMKKKFFSENFLLKQYLTNNGKFGGHPDTNLSLGIDFCSGSLGNGLSVASGMAYTFKKENKENKVFVLIGDGECNEGIIWESTLFAAQHKLNNLYVILDYNKLQGFGSTKDIINLDPVKSKFKSFNWNVVEADGHNIVSLLKALKSCKNNKDRPNLIIAHTIKGKYIKFMENKFESHYQVLSKQDFIISLKDLEN